jgi:hypothetical protein
VFVLKCLIDTHNSMVFVCAGMTAPYVRVFCACMRAAGLLHACRSETALGPHNEEGRSGNFYLPFYLACAL